MNLRAVGWMLGCVVLLLAGFMLLPAGVALFYDERRAALAFVQSSVLVAVLGGLAAYLFRGSTMTFEGRQDYFRREGMAVVGLSWLLAAVVGALPFLFCGVLSSPVDAFFESASGFTTTGATVFSAERIDQLPQAIHFWRCFTHWLGGIGIVMVFVLLAPTGGRSLFRSEVPGISREANLQRVRDSALALFRVYISLTLLAAALLWSAGMGVFDAFLHSFSTLATGGFSSHGESIAYFHSVRIEMICVVFMFAAGLNFGLYDAMLRFGPRRAWRLALASAELRLYVTLIVAATGLCTLILWLWGGSNGDITTDLTDYRSFLRAARDSLFSVVSVQTSTGFGTADFDRWPDVLRLLLVLVMLVGACAGSTGGGLKVVRVLIVAKAALTGIRHFARPRAIHSVRLDGATLDKDLVASATSYVVLWILVATFGSLALALLGVDLVTAVTAAVASLNNIGPGLLAVGPSANYGALPVLGKLLLSLIMIVGRLEFYALVILVLPGFWRR